MSIDIGNLHYQVIEENLEEVSVEHGKVDWSQISIDRETIRRLGFLLAGNGI